KCFNRSAHHAFDGSAGGPRDAPGGILLAELCETFEARFGRSPEAAARAPGRVNLIGEHTDYSGGLVLPCAIDRATWAAAARRDDGRARVWSREIASGQGDGPQAFEVAAPKRSGGWIDYVAGVVQALAEAGHAPGGFDLALASDVPLGSGLSSSASLEVAVATVLDALFGWGLSPLARARIAHRAETRFVGVACGIMDPFASALCQEGHALRLDCRSEETCAIPFPAERPALLLAHSGVRRELAAAAYNARVAECEQALAGARKLGLEADALSALRDLVPEQLPALASVLAPTPLRRVRHVISENARVDALAAALAAGELEAAGVILRAGMRSLRDDYEVSTPELDLLCAAANDLPGVHGSRLTGAGWGGCTLHLVDRDAVPAVTERLGQAFASAFGRRPPIWSLRPSAGAESLPLPGAP
ncbi:MAG: galactokinase, partial [Myxococcota bacterium]